MHEATLTLFEQGRKAYADGLDLDDNPYRSKGRYFHDEWERGWEDMRRIYTSECRIRKAKEATPVDEEDIPSNEPIPGPYLLGILAYLAECRVIRDDSYGHRFYKLEGNKPANPYQERSSSSITAHRAWERSWRAMENANRELLESLHIHDAGAKEALVIVMKKLIELNLIKEGHGQTIVWKV
jgi:hypothetical protein